MTFTHEEREHIIEALGEKLGPEIEGYLRELYASILAHYERERELVKALRHIRIIAGDGDMPPLGRLALISQAVVQAIASD